MRSGDGSGPARSSGWFGKGAFDMRANDVPRLTSGCGRKIVPDPSICRSLYATVESGDPAGVLAILTDLAHSGQPD